ncbi:MAG: DUF5916 domain-containing protein [Bacteroidota bacterium]
MRKHRIIYLIPLLLLVLAKTSLAQNPPTETILDISISNEPIVIDGELNEKAWLNADVAKGFFQTFPIDDQLADEQTEVKLTYDDKNLYIGAVCYTSQNGEYIIESLRRDFGFGRNDVFAVYIDPYNDQSNGFSFQVTPYNVQREGIVTLGGDVADNWDNKWFSEVKRFKDKWVVEMAIPFKSFRYNSTKQWNINFLRNHPMINQRSTWIAVPIQYRSSDLVYTGKLNWDTPPKPTNTNIALIPYITGQNVNNFEENTGEEQKGNVGFDAKIGVTPSLNLDLTVNPDFSQVEVDQQVNNLGRFEISFPERRQFFLENQDLFAQNGFRSSRPFFSRRIGIIGSGSSAKQIPILAGARLSGKIGKDWRVGLLNMQTDSDIIEEEFFPAQNYTVAVFQRQIQKRSNIGGVFVNRMATNFDKSDTSITSAQFNRVIGVDYNLATENNRWTGNTYYHRSITPEKDDESYAQGTFLRYQTRNLEVNYFHNMIGENYNAEVGFIRRVGIRTFGTNTSYSFWPTNSKTIVNHGPQIRYSITMDSDFDLLDRDINASYRLSFLNTSEISTRFTRQMVTLRGSFAPNGIEADTLLEGSIHRFNSIQLSYRSDRRKLFNFDTQISRGSFYTGSRTNYQLNLNYRFQPIFRAGLNVDYNRLNFPEPFSSVEYLLIGTRLDLTLTNKFFVTSFIQYNDRADNFNINTRLQWRFKPVSDVFLVYTENYGGDFMTNDLVPEINNSFKKNRALVLKITYWLNI